MDVGQPFGWLVGLHLTMVPDGLTHLADRHSSMDSCDYSGVRTIQYRKIIKYFLVFANYCKSYGG